MKFLFFGVVVFCISCAGVNTVAICSAGRCATGYYYEDGNAATAAHPFDEGSIAEIRGAGGYTDRGIVHISGNDSATVETSRKFPQGLRYEKVAAGDFVTISTSYGPVRSRVVRVAPNGFVISAELLPGDSGAPVTRRGNIAGFVHGLSADGGTVILERNRN